MTDPANPIADRKARPAPVNDPALAALHQMYGYFDRNAATAEPSDTDTATDKPAKAAA